MRLASLRTPPRSGLLTPVRTSGYSTPASEGVPRAAFPGGAAPLAVPQASRSSPRAAPAAQQCTPRGRSPRGTDRPVPDLFGKASSDCTANLVGHLHGDEGLCAHLSPTGTTCSQSLPGNASSPVSSGGTMDDGVPLLEPSSGKADSNGRETATAMQEMPHERRFTLCHVRGKAGELPHSPRLRLRSDKEERGDGHLCICEICNCGMHSCHHKPQPARFESETTNNAFYTPHVLSPRPPLPPQSPRKPQRQPFEGESTYKLAFQEKQLPEKPTVPEPCPPHSLPFEGSTSYREDFVRKTAHFDPQQPPAAKPRQPFYGETSYKHFYNQKPLQPRPERERSSGARKNTESVAAEPQTFEGESSYRDAFKAKPLPEPHWTAPVKQAPLPFEGESSYNADYTPKSSAPFDPPPALPQKPWQPFYGETSYGHHHGEKPLPQRPSRPRSAPTTSRDHGQSFQGCSTYKHDYYAKPPTAEPQTPRRAPVVAPDARDFSTTYGGDYTKREIPVCPVALMPGCPCYSPEGREHSFWHEDSQRWC